MTKQDIDIFEKVQSQLEGLHTEISVLSKKSQNDALNKFKLKFVNQIISEANELLGDEYRPFADFSLFDDSEIPTNSDVAMMLTQYLSCLEKLRADNVKQDKYGRWHWLLNGKESDIKAVAPKILKG